MGLFSFTRLKMWTLNADRVGSLSLASDLDGAINSQQRRLLVWYILQDADTQVTLSRKEAKHGAMRCVESRSRDVVIG
jgi:hypothetical protein